MMDELQGGEGETGRKDPPPQPGRKDEDGYFTCPGGCGYSIGDCHCK